ncbi:flagellar motor switch phosphatase FliY [Neobacillus sp. SM06]|uniref:flagellar motor switch phosphatase FliY n=1 Tax=Neobacillus sp. SM06 TaxID=3422492 RepID=UPI003D2A97E6
MMSDDMLSQDEIDALLRGTGDDDFQEDFGLDGNEIQDDFLTPMEKDALGEIGNISFGSSATALSTLLNQKVEITTPNVLIVLRKNLSEEFPHPYVGIQVGYTEGFSGSNLLIIQQSDAAIIADLMLGGDGTAPNDLMGEIQLSAVQEAMNQMMGSAATSMSTVFNKRVDISPPTINILDVSQGEGTDQLPDEEQLVKISFRLKVGSLIDSTIMQLLPLHFAKQLVFELMNPGQVAETMASAYQAFGKDESFSSNGSEPKKSKEAAMEANAGFDYGTENSFQNQQSNQAQVNQTYNQAAAYANPNSAPQHLGSGFQGAAQPTIQPAVFSDFESQHAANVETKNLDMLLDIPLQVTVELGRTKRSVKEILELSTGSIIELDKLAGEPVDVLVNNRLVAKGEVVVIDENFGVRVTDIISQSDRIKKLR